MRIKYKNKIYHVQWPKRYDKIILKAAKGYKRSDGTVNWKGAEADRMLKGLPVFLTLKDISQRNSHLKMSKKPGYKKKKLIANRKYQKLHPTTTEGTLKKKKLFANIVPDEIKKKYGWKPRTIWTEEQRGLLFKLSERYRKSKDTIDWKKLAEDKRVEKLPFQDSFKLCKYYNSLKRKKKGGKKFIKKRRKDALIYKYENYTTYRQKQEETRVRIKNSVNEFLLSQLELR